MVNLWEFLLQTLTVSLAAGLILHVKAILTEQLSPRWQYWVWSVLALRIVVPASVFREVLIPISLWLETLKGRAEAGLHSAFTDIYELIEPQHVIPLLKGAPQSWTDWMFAIYGIGVAGSLLFYGWNYLRLRLLLSKAQRPDDAISEQVNRICGQYHLKSCAVAVVPGLPSAFVCGVIRPVLAVPQTPIDDKVLLHELMHCKHHDALQNIIWCALRSLHWCNPFLQYVCNCIGNDMESLCDQRVLELLEGEERREYGKILLSMTNRRYARAPGTSSISNGGRNIARRIAAIARFKRYPAGMALVAVCIILVLIQPLVIGGGTEEAQTADKFQAFEVEDLPEVMARARLTRCQSAVAALDTYAKGLQAERGTILAVVTPKDRHAQMVEQMISNMETLHIIPCFLDSGWELSSASYDYYGIYNLQERDDGCYAQLLFNALRVNPPEVDPWLNPLRDEEGNYLPCSVIIPVRAWEEDGKWLVEETGDRIISNAPVEEVMLPGGDAEPAIELKVAGETGTVTISTMTSYVPAAGSGYSAPMDGFTANDHTIHPILSYQARSVTYVEYDVTHEVLTDEVGFWVTEIWDLDDAQEMEREEVDGNGGGSATGAGFDNDCHRCSSVDIWRRSDMRFDTLAGWSETRTSGIRSQPEGYLVCFYLNGELVEEYVVEVPQ